MTAEDLDFLSLCLRRCQCHISFMALGRSSVNRKYESVVWDLRVSLAKPTDGPPLNWQHGGVSTPKAELRTNYSRSRFCSREN